MTGTGLPSGVETSAIVRSVEGNGDFAAILRRGDADRGALLLVIGSRGRHVACLQRALDYVSGSYRWSAVGPAAGASAEEIRDFLRKQSDFDPDSWQIELDIAAPERFIAETTASG